MANAYDVMSMAKRQGAEVKAVDRFNDYMDKVRAEEARASKAGMLGKIGGSVGGSIAGFLAPAAITALGVGTGGIGSLLLAGALGTGISRGGTEIGDFLARQWGAGGKGRAKEFQDIGKMEGISGAYGQRHASDLMQQSKSAMETQRNTIAEMLDIENMNRWLASGFSGLQTAGKVRAGAEALGTAGQTISEIWGGDKSFGKRFLEGLKGQGTWDIKSGYTKAGIDTGDWWKEMLNKKP
jgi:hypothetical protein